MFGNKDFFLFSGMPRKCSRAREPCAELRQGNVTSNKIPVLVTNTLLHPHCASALNVAAIELNSCLGSLTQED
jgi:hypothetical protein